MSRVESSAATRVFIVAEAGMNHDGSLGLACRLVDAAAECRADAVKFQLHIAEAETLSEAPCPPYFTEEPRDAYFRRTAFSEAQWAQLKRHCESRGVEFVCSPFSLEAVEVLERVGVARYKIASGEVTNLPLLERVAATGKPVLLSSGMSTWAELDAAVAAVRRSHQRLTVLQCTSAYPCPDEQVGLNVLEQLTTRYGVPVGLSDHTMANYAAYAAVALGATVIEKHLTLSRRMYGSDAAHSLEPAEYADLVQGIRAIERMVAHPVDKDDVSRFHAMKRTFEKSVVAVAPIPAGSIITPQMLGLKKPGTGLPAAKLTELIGKRAARTVAANTLLTAEDVVWKDGAR